MMTTAKDFAAVAGNMKLMAEQMKPNNPTDRHAEIRNVIVYHLRSAASKALAVAEDLAKTEVQE